MKCNITSVTIELLSLSNISKEIKNSQYKLEVFFGSSRDSTRELNYYINSGEISIDQVLHLKSEHAKQLEFWLIDSRNKQFIGFGIHKLSGEGLQMIDICIDKNILSILKFNVNMSVYDIYKKVELEEDESILKKDNTEELRLQKEKEEEEAKLKKEQELAEQLRNKPKKQAIVTITNRYVQNETYY